MAIGIMHLRIFYCYTTCFIEVNGIVGVVLHIEDPYAFDRVPREVEVETYDPMTATKFNEVQLSLTFDVPIGYTRNTY